MIRVVVVEDSPDIRDLLVHALDSDPEISVVATANNGQEAVEATKQKRPDVVTMDLNMPNMDGFEAICRIMEIQPTPIVIVRASGDAEDSVAEFQAMEAGALAVARVPSSVDHPDYKATVKELTQTVKLMSEVRVVTRWPRTRQKTVAPAHVLSDRVKPNLRRAASKIVAIGASTGGPLAIQEILRGLPKDFPLPVLIIQHMAEGFTQRFVEWLNKTCGLPVHLAADGDHISPGHVYVGPDGFHMGMKTGDRIVLSKSVAENGLRPSVSYLLRSVAETYGQNVVGVLLTGMGVDGAAELKTLKEKGAITIAQDKESSVVHGMPGRAIEMGAASLVLSPQEISAALVRLLNQGKEG